MKRVLGVVLVGIVAGCGGVEEPSPQVVFVPAVHEVVATPAHASTVATSVPRAPGEYAPSLVAIDRRAPKSDVSDGTMLADVDSCSTCHPDAAAQWSSSAHSFASFGNPIYRANVELVRDQLGKEASRHCGGCHDMPLTADGLMTADAAIPPADLRSHSGVTCRLCHGVTEATADGNGSYVWSNQPIDAPELGNAASIAAHKRQVTTKLDDTLCTSCHRGFLSPDLGLPVHLTGVDEPTGWRSSAYTGNGLARIDSVKQQTCIDCHMERVPASTADELGAKHGTIASHRFVGGHTWMASMRGDREQLAKTRAKLEGVASIDIAGARVARADHSATRSRAAQSASNASGNWHLPADGAPVIAGSRLELDVVIRNLLAGHRFPGGLLDVQDTWIEVEVTDRAGKRLASSGLDHATDPDDESAHVLRTIVVDEDGRMLEQHEVGAFRTQVATHTLEAREARAVRYAFAVPPKLSPAQLPLTVTARLQHRSRSLKMQQAACASTKTAEGQAFLAGARGARDVELDACKPQPITTIAQTRAQLGAGAQRSNSRPQWERMYEHGMALVATVVTRLDEARTVLSRALAEAPDARARAMVTIQAGWVAAKQQRVDEALAHVAKARALLASTVPAGQPAPNPAVLDAVAADAYARAYRWKEAVEPARACTERAPDSTVAWTNLARIELAARDFAAAQAAAVKGLALSPRDPKLLEVQATALRALQHPASSAALAAYDRFRAPDIAPGLRIECSKGSKRCDRDRNPVQTIELIAAGATKLAAR